MNSTIKANDYLIVCLNSENFTFLFPEVNNYIGDFDFGLKNAGELIRLFNISGDIIDSVTYDDKLPWPTEPDGNGSTLELLNPKLDNSIAENWSASKDYGTPGLKNSVFRKFPEDNDDDQKNDFIVMQNHPNPFNCTTNIFCNATLNNKIIVKIYNINGKLVKILNPAIGENCIVWNASEFSSGIYFYQGENGGKKSKVKKAILLK